MGYMHIENLYKNREILMFKECYALEKIHGTSAHVRYDNGSILLFSGDVSRDKMAELFDVTFLKEQFASFMYDEMAVFGELYGEKTQRMSGIYGKELKFVAFDVKINGSFISVPNAEEICKTLGIDFVSYKKISTDLSEIDRERDAPSEQAFKNGVSDRENPETYKLREGVILRPLIELTKNNGQRVICKHKRDEFRERATLNSEIDPERLKILNDAEEIAKEWVTKMRLTHVLSKMDNVRDFKKIPEIISNMIEDVFREASGEISGNEKENKKAIGRMTVKLYKEYLKEDLHAE